jgi:Flp pilus assembly pilin Flp
MLTVVELCTRLSRSAKRSRRSPTETRLAHGQTGPRVSRGQTMTEYALILAAIAIAVFVTYQTMGNNIDTLAQQIDAQLSAAAS